MSRPRYAQPEPLERRHRLLTFDCGNEAMDRWLRDHALDNESSNVSRTYVVADIGDTVVAYYSLASGRIDLAELPKRLQRNMPQVVPMIVLGRLAVDRSHSGLGLGPAMLREAMQRTLHLSGMLGAFGLLVHAINDDAAPFYTQYGFLPSPTQSLSLILPLKTIKAALSPA